MPFCYFELPAADRKPTLLGHGHSWVSQHGGSETGTGGAGLEPDLLTQALPGRGGLAGLSEGPVMRRGAFTQTLGLENNVFHICTRPDLCSPTEGLA